MNVPMIFVAVIICLMALYTMNRFIRRPGVFSIFLLLIQLLTASVTIFSIFENVMTTPVFELSVILSGVVLPTLVIIYDHCITHKKMKKMGVIVEFIEKKEKKTQERWSISAFTESAELWKQEIHSSDVFRSLSVKEIKIKENIKKQLVLIQRLINLERYERAAEQYRFILSILPDSPLVAYNTGYLYCFIGRYREAYKILRKALAMNKKADISTFGSIKSESSEKPEKYDMTEKLEKPGKYVVTEKSGNLEKYDMEEKLEKTRTSETSEITKKSGKSYKQYSNKDFDAMIHFNIGFALYNLKKYEHAIRHFQKVIEYKPDLSVAYKNIARAFLKINMNDKAIEYLEKGRLDLHDEKMRIVLGSIYYEKNDTKKALEVLDEAAISSTKQLEALLWRGKAAIKEKEFDKAMGCFKALVQKEPEEARHYHHLALAQRLAGEKEAALRTYEKGINIAPQNSVLLYNMGTMLDELGKKDKAVQVLYKSLQCDETPEDAFNYLGVLLGQLKRYRESVQVFEKGIYLYKNSYQLYFNQGIVLEMARRLEDASVSFEKAYELDRKDPVLIYYYTATLLKLREYSKAIRIYKTGISNFPKDAELIYGLSKVYVNMGETDIAVDLLKKALELDSSYIIKLKKDIDFKILYNHSEYQSLLSS